MRLTRVSPPCYVKGTVSEVLCICRLTWNQPWDNLLARGSRSSSGSNKDHFFHLSLLRSCCDFVGTLLHTLVLALDLHIFRTTRGSVFPMAGLSYHNLLLACAECRSRRAASSQGSGMPLFTAFDEVRDDADLPQLQRCPAWRIVVAKHPTRGWVKKRFSCTWTPKTK